MTEARIGLSIVTTMKAVGYPECEDLTAHPLARFSKRCDGGAAYVGQTSDSESCAQPVVGRCALRLKPRSQIHPLPLPGQPSPVVLHTEASPQAPERGQTFEPEITPVLNRRSFHLRTIGAIPSFWNGGDERGPMNAARVHRMRFLLYAAGHLRETTSN
jgi:hypothetical protein